MADVADKFTIRIGGEERLTRLPGGVASTVHEQRALRKTAGIAWEFRGQPPQQRFVGDGLQRHDPEVLGILGEKLTDRHVAFLFLVISDGGARPARWNEWVGRRARFRERLGMTEDGFEKWIKRNLPQHPGAILRWNERRSFGHGPARSEGSWRVVAREVCVEPSPSVVAEFIERTASDTTLRRDDPEGLLGAAAGARRLDDWGEALLLAEDAAQVFWRRRRSRAEPLWFEILLTIGSIEMQLGRTDLKPTIVTNIERSLSNPRQRLRGPAAQVFRSEAHHLAALIWNQRGGARATAAAIEELRIGDDAAGGIRTPEATRQVWKNRAYEELIRARAEGVVPAGPESSAIWQSVGVFCDLGEPWRAEQERMRYGEALVCAGRATEAMGHIERALASGQLTTAGRIIAERVQAVARWTAGGNARRAAEQLDSLELRARQLEFAHQIRTIQQDRLRILQGARRVC